MLSSVFAWNLLLTGHPKAIPGKIQRDLPPTIVNGWKFWIPVSAANFRVVPLQQQVSSQVELPSVMLRPFSSEVCNLWECSMHAAVFIPYTGKVLGNAGPFHVDSWAHLADVFELHKQFLSDGASCPLFDKFTPSQWSPSAVLQQLVFDSYVNRLALAPSSVVPLRLRRSTEFSVSNAK